MQRTREKCAVEMTVSDKAELEWWRSSFAVRFGPGPGGCPPIHSSFVGRRFILCVYDTAGNLKPYDTGDEALGDA